MSRKRIFISALVTAILLGLIYLQVRSWRRFDWQVLRDQTSSLNWALVAGGALMIYLADALRGVRWALFLRPVKRVDAMSLVPAQFIGFAALTLLGRPGELIRPYLIARKTNLDLPSQIAVWTVERIFDVAAVTILLSADILFSKSLRQLKLFPQIREGGMLLVAGVIVGVVIAVLLSRRGAAIATWIDTNLHNHFPRLARKLSAKVQAFSEGLNTIHDMRSFLFLSALSLLIWLMIAASYRFVTSAYQGPLNSLGLAQVLLLMFFSVAGGIVQLPVVGGGSQLMTIAALKSVFGFAPELATSCGIMIWLVTFVSVVPVGLVLARREHVSLTKLAQEEELAENIEAARSEGPAAAE